MNISEDDDDSEGDPPGVFEVVLKPEEGEEVEESESEEVDWVAGDDEELAGRASTVARSRTRDDAIRLQRASRYGPCTIWSKNMSQH